MNRDTIKDLTLMLMYLTSWEESLARGISGQAEARPTTRLCWKGYDFNILNELTDEGLVNAGGHRKSASFHAEGEERAVALLKKYGIELE